MSAPRGTAGRSCCSGGLPIREPIAPYGPFLMNTRDEIIQAVEELQASRMGMVVVGNGARLPHQGRRATVPLMAGRVGGPWA